MAKRLIHVKAVVQHHFVVIDGEDGAEELVTDPNTVPAKAWVGYLAGGWEQALASLRQQVEQPADGGGK